MSIVYSHQPPLVKELMIIERDLIANSDERHCKLEYTKPGWTGSSIEVEDFPRSVRRSFIFSTKWDRDAKPFRRVVSVTYSKISYEDLGWV